ncbi:hypothetical protein HU200_019465 [Digitaria exilis]|uniref:Uncharacterized protein n=1 Tax=Digitaria exilis TaxID=1010633 RepID=A0A835F3J7_9POAL|nr:hypothetical protein HU200_019465 [Digitaria exilis]
MQEHYHQYRPPDHNQDQHELQCS